MQLKLVRRLKGNAVSPEERDGGGRYAGGWRVCVGELGGAPATLDREPPNLRLKSATRPLTLPTWALVALLAVAAFCCTGGNSDINLPEFGLEPALPMSDSSLPDGPLLHEKRCKCPLLPGPGDACWGLRRSDVLLYRPHELRPVCPGEV